MNHYITPDNKTWGFDETQIDLIPNDAIEIPSTFTFDQYRYLILINGEVSYNKNQHDEDIAKLQAQEQAQETAKASALAKLAALGLTQDEVTALIG